MLHAMREQLCEPTSGNSLSHFFSVVLPSCASLDARQQRDRVAQAFEFVMRVSLVHVARLVAGQRHPALFGDTGIGEKTAE